jgi:hypothetical protein
MVINDFYANHTSGRKHTNDNMETWNIMAVYDLLEVMVD